MKVASHFLLLIIVLGFISCSSSKVPKSVGLLGNKLQDCPRSPNCVCSDEKAESPHYITPFGYTGSGSNAFSRLVLYLKKLNRVEVKTQTRDYIHITVKSAFFKFVDDVEFHMRDKDKIMAVRSASRTGEYDFGVNRKRVESIRADLGFR